MRVKTIDDLKGSEDEIRDNDFVSRRLVLAADDMGYSVHDTEIAANKSLHMWYKHHLETVLITEGGGTIEDLGSGQTHDLKPGVMYALNEHDKHILRAGNKGLRMTCVFYPALVGPETHQ
jgi:L-ectoine synthase